MPANGHATARSDKMLKNCATKWTGKKGFIKKLRMNEEANPDTNMALRMRHKERAVE
jgi:hypothetical protein